MVRRRCSSNGVVPGSACSSARIMITKMSACSGSAGSNRMTGESLAILFDQLRDQAGPAGLVTGTNAGPIVSVKKFVEQNQVLPVRIGVEDVGSACDGTAAVLARRKNAHKATGDFRSHLPQIAFSSGMGGAFHFEIFAEIMVEFLQRFDQQIVPRKPDRSAPIRIAAEQAGGRFRGLD